MDNITHTLTGIALSKAAFDRKTRFATLAMVLASNLPDIDVVTAVKGSAVYLKDHRGFTHSFLGAALLACALGAAIAFLGGKAKPSPRKPPINWKWLIAICWIGAWVHVLMDYSNQYGIRLFAPFTWRWFSWDIEPIVDPLLLVCLLGGLGLPAVLHLVSEEVGAGTFDRKGYRRGAQVALAGMVLVWGLRDFSHRRALSLLDSRGYGSEDTLELGAFPSPVNPFQWTGVAETASAYYVLDANSLDDDLNMQSTHIYRKPRQSPLIDAASKAWTAQVFLNFARFPLAQVTANDQGTVVAFRDLRFMPRDPSRGGFVAWIVLDDRMDVIDQHFSFTGRGTAP